MKFLVDEKLSPKIASYLTSIGYSATTVRDEGSRGNSDQEIAQWVKDSTAIIVIRDLDFGRLYKQITTTGILILRGKDDSTESAISILKKLHMKKILSQSAMMKQLTVATETRVRCFKRDFTQNDSRH